MAKPRRKFSSTRIAPSQREERKRKVFIITGGIIMAALMIFSIVGIIQDDPGGNRLTYGQYTFRVESRGNGGSVLVTDINGYGVEFQNLPTQVLIPPMDPGITPLLLNAQQVGLVSDPNLNISDASNVDYARLQLALTMQKTVNGMIAEGEHVQPVLTCERASSQFPLVFFNITNETSRLSLDKYCVTLSGKDQDLMRLKDRMIFEYIGIVKDGVIIDE